MPPPPSMPQPTLTLGDIYYILFRHKWKIVVCTLVGLVAAGVTFYLQQKAAPIYVSDAKLFVRYVLTESRNFASDATAKSPDRGGETIMSSEVEILSSADLAAEVVEAVGAEKILGKNPEKGISAIAIVRSQMSVAAAPLSSVIRVSFWHHDADVVQPVVREVVARYLKRHQEIHRGSGFAGDFLAQETDQLRTRLAQTEEDLHKARSKVGVISIEGALKEHAAQLAGIRQQIFNAQADLAERKSIFEEFSKRASAQPTAIQQKEPDSPPAIEAIEEFKAIQMRLTRLQEQQQTLSLTFTAENARLREIQSQIVEVEASRKKLLTEHPKLARVAPTIAVNQGIAKEQLFDAVTALAQINALQAKIKVLELQEKEVREDAAKIDQVEGTINELERKKALDEANYRQYAASLERSRISQAMGDGRVSNITEIQTASLPMLERTKMSKIAAGIALGGLALGLGWAFSIEMYLDHSIKRPGDLTRMLTAPLFITIPNKEGPKPKKIKKQKSTGRRWWSFWRRKTPAVAEAIALPPVVSADQSPAPKEPRWRVRFWRRKKILPVATVAIPTAQPDGIASPGAAPTSALSPVPCHQSVELMPFFETLRDRLIAFFESKNLRHNPKLVAVTGIGSSSGVTTVAAGLARSLSEIGEGNVLLVDLTSGQGSAQQFLGGRAVCGLDEMLDARDHAHVGENLYVVTEHNKNSDQLSRNFPQRFTKLVPKLKASNFDYIIFDMPAVSQISITPRLAAFMDMVLLVAESGKTNRDIFQQATAMLSGSKSHVGVVLNKMRTYGPKRLHQETLATS